MAFIFKYLKGNYWLFFISIMASIVAAFFSLLVSLIIGFVLDNVLQGLPITNPILQIISNIFGSPQYIKDNFYIVFMMVIIISVILVLALLIRYYLQTYISEDITYNLRNQLYDHLQKLDYKYHVNAQTGDLVQRCTSDVDVIRRLYAGQLNEVVQAFSIAIIAVSILWQINKALTFYAVLLMPLMLLYAFFYFKKVQDAFLALDHAEADLTTYSQELLSGIRVVKAFNTEEIEVERFIKHNENFKKLDYQLIKVIGQYWSISDFICYLQIIIVMLVGIVFAHSGKITLGDFVIFFGFESMIVWPVRQIGRILSDIGKAKVSYNRIQEILDVPQENFDDGIKPLISGNIEFKNVSFSYDTTPILKNINLSITKGETIAIIGPTASGKSTLIALLNRLYDVTDGEILIDGVNINDINKPYLRQYVGLVLQEPFLYSKSIYNNIQLNNHQLNDKSIHDAAINASVHQDIINFEKGYDTLVGEKGVTLSGGQKQRIAIARTIINQTPIIIFDDSLSAVDSETDQFIQAQLKKINHNSTTIIITQRINSAQNADKIVILENGSISMIGSHQDLVTKDGLYKRIYDIQSKWMKEDFDDNPI